MKFMQAVTKYNNKQKHNKMFSWRNKKNISVPAICNDADEKQNTRLALFFMTIPAECHLD